MFIHHRTKGIVLKKIDRGDADQLLIIYTKDFGKLEIMARAVRKIVSKLRSGSELFCFSEVEFIQGKRHKTLTDAVLIEKFKNLRENLNALKSAYKIVETFDELVKSPEADNEIWVLLNNVFHALNKYSLKSEKYILLYYYFFWNFVSMLGYYPEIKNCSIQKKEFPCDVVKIIKVILKKDLSTLLKIKINSLHLKLLQRISIWYRLKVLT